MSAAPRRRGQAARWAGQRERRRAEFVAAALETIAEHGPGATVEQIAARAGVARTRIYRHFTDRADLEHAISARVADLIVAELDPLWHPEGSTHQMISAVIGAHARWLAANRHLYAYLVAHGGGPADPDGLDGYSGVRQAVARAPHRPVRRVPRARRGRRRRGRVPGLRRPRAGRVRDEPMAGAARRPGHRRPRPPALRLGVGDARLDAPGRRASTGTRTPRCRRSKPQSVGRAEVRGGRTRASGDPPAT